MTKIYVRDLYPRADKKTLAKIKTSFTKNPNKWLVVSCSGTFHYATEEDAELQRKKLKSAGEFATVHHVKSVTF